MPVHDRSSFENLYTGQPRWEIGRPQRAFLEAADRITGSILDAGCGTGEIALHFARLGHAVTGIDFLSEPIEEARRKSRERGIPAAFLVMDALKLGEGRFSEVFDTVLDSGLFHNFSDADRRKYVAGLASVLRPGGRLFMLCFSDAEPGDQGPRRISRQDLDDAFAQGWDMESVEPSEYEVRSDSPGFAAGGPKAWFIIARRTH